jgi:hypothetical protein
MFLRGFLKKKLAQNSKVNPLVLPKNIGLCKKQIETSYFLVVAPYLRSVIHNGHVYKFLYVLKNSNFASISIYAKN